MSIHLEPSLERTDLMNELASKQQSKYLSNIFFGIFKCEYDISFSPQSVMECIICFSVLKSSENNIYSTVCGHVFHLKCLEDWLRCNQNCPKCRKVTMRTQIFQIFLDFDSSNSISNADMEKIQLLPAVIESRNDKFELMLTEHFGRLTQSISKFEHQNEILKNENADLKELIKGMKGENEMLNAIKNNSTALKDELKKKDATIANLQQIIADLKIQNQTRVLKQNAQAENKDNPRAPLTRINRSDSKKSTSLTLKFDCSDQLIIE